MGALPSSREIRFFQREILAWYEVHGRRFPWRNASSSRYERIVCEILLKRTRAETAAKFFRPFVTKYPSWRKLSTASHAELRRYLQPIGLWRQRADSLTRLARELSRTKGRFPRDREAIESLPGVGQYVANAVMLFCHRRAEPLLDGGMARVLERCFGKRTLVDIRYDPWLQSLAKRVVTHERSIQLNWAILDIAAMVCHSKMPDCKHCPIRRRCLHQISVSAEVSFS
jgi:A/G-specific adenine glycosylase